eukprot:CAMPEP_0178410696 /NCGR_PEP_ID=MMETSP0689_2-20121128/21115_1 /TAXON_ID=160604 /ORGANISM="Amphidinium massartii, Strain CS-259" /LENGTH=980 /DNA_ID=CAMNT_0020031885 /DNA_START=8 /DNA_END=2950 /DNA_ORIENTATION=-
MSFFHTSRAAAAPPSNPIRSSTTITSGRAAPIAPIAPLGSSSCCGGGSYAAGGGSFAGSCARTGTNGNFAADRPLESMPPPTWISAGQLPPGARPVTNSGLEATGASTASAKPSKVRSVVDKLKSTFTRSKATPAEEGNDLLQSGSAVYTQAAAPASFGGADSNEAVPGARVMIVGARGLRAPPGTRLSPYASCEVVGVDDSLWTTPCAESTPNPVWEEEYQMPACRQGTTLSFNIYNADPLDEPLLLGHCSLPSDVVHPFGYSGELPIEDGDGMLQVKVTITGPGVAPQMVSGRYPSAAPSVPGRSALSQSAAPASIGRSFQAETAPVSVPADSLCASMSRVSAAAGSVPAVPASTATYGAPQTIKVAVIGVHNVRGLEGPPASWRLFCVCGVSEKPHTAKRTRPMNGSASVSWNEEFDVSDYVPGDSLEFVLMQAGPRDGEEILGMALLSSAQFGNFGYNAELTVSCPGYGIVGLLTVRVTLPGAQPPQAFRQPAGVRTAATGPCGGSAGQPGLFSMLDRNGDGVITRAEFAAAVGSPAGPGSPYYAGACPQWGGSPVAAAPYRQPLNVSSPLISPAASFVAPMPPAPVMTSTSVFPAPAGPMSYPSMPVPMSRPGSFPSAQGPCQSSSEAKVPYPWGGAAPGPSMPKSEFCPSASSGGAARPPSSVGNIHPGPRGQSQAASMARESVPQSSSRRTKDPSYASSSQGGMVIPQQRNESEMGFGSRPGSRQAMQSGMPASLGRGQTTDGGLSLPVSQRSGRGDPRSPQNDGYHQPPTLGGGLGASMPTTQRGGLTQDPLASSGSRRSPDSFHGGGPASSSMGMASGGGCGQPTTQASGLGYEQQGSSMSMRQTQGGPRAVVALISARNLRSADIMGKSDPYATCEIIGKPQSKVQTQVVHQSLNPVWNEEFELLDFQHGDDLLINVYDKDEWPKKDDFLGECTVSGGFFGPYGLEEMDFSLENAGTPDATIKFKVMISS